MIVHLSMHDCVHTYMRVYTCLDIHMWPLVPVCICDSSYND